MPAAPRPDLDAVLGLLRAGRLDEAGTACRALLRAQPALVDAWFLLGQLAERDGDTAQAVDAYRRALALAPAHAGLRVRLAGALCRQGRPAEAMPLLQQALAQDPASARARHALAALLADDGRIDEARAQCEAGLALQADEPNLGGLLAELLMQQDQYADARVPLLRALAQAPGHAPNQVRFCRWLQRESLSCAQTGARALLLAALTHPVNRPGDLAAAIASGLRDDATIIEAMHAAASIPDAASAARICARLGADALLMTLMTSTVIPDVGYERMFTALRRALLLDTRRDGFGAEVLPFCAALAIQAFLSDYAWDLDDDERARLDADEAATPLALVLQAMYRPLHERADAATLAARDWPAPIAELMRVQVSEPLAERADHARIPRLTAITDAVSQQVRAQYEEHPYPRWVRAGRAVEALALDELLRALGGEAPRDDSFARPEVLIAGCGSGEQAIYAASAYHDARLLAIDLSLASLAYARRKTREPGLDAVIDYRQGDLMALSGLERRFHLIECIGVLHHLGDPLAGWRVLTGLLRAGGLMRIALYSERGRRAIVDARAWIAEQGWPPTAAGIRRCRRALLALPDGHPLARLRRLRDFYNLSECRDLLFHVQEHRFTLPRIEAALAQLGLRFLGFATAPVAAAEWRRRHPDDPHMRSLAHWHAFEEAHPEAFAGMYEFWVQKA